MEKCLIVPYLVKLSYLFLLLLCDPVDIFQHFLIPKDVFVEFQPWLISLEVDKRIILWQVFEIKFWILDSILRNLVEVWILSKVLVVLKLIDPLGFRLLFMQNALEFTDLFLKLITRFKGFKVYLALVLNSVVYFPLFSLGAGNSFKVINFGR